MKIPTQITFRNVDRSQAVVAHIEAETTRLEKYFNGITSCRVLIEPQHSHHQRGDAFHVRIELGVPGNELIVARDPVLHDPEEGDGHPSKKINAAHQDPFVAIRDAFMVMRRQLQDYVHCLRNEVKFHAEQGG